MLGSAAHVQRWCAHGRRKPVKPRAYTPQHPAHCVASTLHNNSLIYSGQQFCTPT